MKCASIAVLCSLLVACSVPAPMVAPAPMNLTSPLSPVLAVQRAAQRVTIEGFAVTTSGATGGILTATLTKQGEGSWGPFVACRWGDSSLGHTSGRVSLTLRMTAQSAGTGSTIFLGSSARTVVSAGMLSSDNETDCASSGEIEKRLAAALATP